jgi:hypothetical protein
LLEDHKDGNAQVAHHEIRGRSEGMNRPGWRRRREAGSGGQPACLDSVTRSHRSHENIIAILDIIVPNHYRDFHEVYLVQELMETDLWVARFLNQLSRNVAAHDSVLMLL